MQLNAAFPHAPRAGYWQALLPEHHPINPGSYAMLEALVRFIEELIDILNFGNSIAK